MGESVDWLDVYREAGSQAVADAMRAAGAAAVASPPQASSLNPHTSHPPHSPNGDSGAGDDPHFVPPEELVLPSQAGPRAMVVLRRMFNPDRPGEAWQLRRFAAKWYIFVRPGHGLPRWKEIDDETLRGAVRQLLEGYWTRRWVEKTGEWKYQRFAPTDRVVEDILRAVVHRLFVTAESVPAWLPADFDEAGAEVEDRQRWRRDHEDDGPIDPSKVIAFRNGLFDVGAWLRGEARLLPHSSRWFATSTLDTDLPIGLLRDHAGDPEELAVRLGEMCPSWLDFVAETSGGSEQWVEALQRFIGYCMTPDTRLDKMLWVQGPPGTGKTTLVEAVEAVVGYENAVETDLDALAGRFGVTPLVGKLVAVIPEMHVGHMTNVAAALQRLKAISGGAPQQIDDKFAKIRTRVRMTVRFIVTPNEEPRLPDASAAITRRLVVLPVLHLPERLDPGLGERLEAERAGIRVWALLGLRRLWEDVARGMPAFPQPPEGRELLDEIEAKSSPMRQFVRERCVVGAGNSVAVDTLYALHLAFRKDEGLSGEMAKQTFGSQMRAAVPGLRRASERVGEEGTRMYVYHGLRPRLEQDDGKPRANVRMGAAYLEDERELVWDDPRTPV